MLDPQAQAIIDRVRAAGIRPWHEQEVAPARLVYMERIRLLAVPPIPVARVVDVSLPGPTGSLMARIYHPMPGTVVPTVLYLHGGGWVLGSPDSHDQVCREIAATSGCLVVSLDYRLAPEHPHPAALEDAHATLRWLSSHAATLEGDGLRIVVAGDSAGGHLSASLAIAARDEGGPQLRGQVLIYPSLAPDFDTPSCLANATGYLLTRADMVWFWGHYLAGQPADGVAAPSRVADLSGLAPALVITAEFDPLHDEGRDYAHRLLDAGVPVRLDDYPGMIHGFVALPGGPSQGRLAVGRIAEWLKGVMA